MNLKKAPPDKRALPPRTSDCTRAFSNHWDRLSRSGRYDMKRLKSAVWLLSEREAGLGPECLDHALKGESADHRECPSGGDFLLIYQFEASSNRIVFVRAGSHAELFE